MHRIAYLNRALASFVCIVCSMHVDAAFADEHNESAELNCLALALYWEARGESERGMLGVGWVILNRAKHEQFPATLCGVVHQGGETPPCQFSWWCDGKSDRPRDTASWTRARAVAERLIASPPRDPTKGAVFFHNTSIAVPWLRKRKRTARIGNHIFYR